MKQEELNNVLEIHKKWLNYEEGGKKADLRGADLRGADLSRADLCGADLSGANLSGADLSGADLNRANLCYANLRGACLCGADLSGANLSGANLSGADLSGADLNRADLSGADLNRADLSGADLSGADLNRADLSGADLSGANLSGADLNRADLTDVKYNEDTAFFALQCPEKGSFIAYKKVNNIVIELEVPADAERSSATSRKCRCSKAKVLWFYDLNRNALDIDEVVNNNYVETVYRKGEMVYPDSWDEDRWNECSHGIHFFITFEEAKNY